MYICWVVPKVTSPPAQSYAAQNQCYTDKWLSQIFGREPLSLRAKGTNAPSIPAAWQTQSAALGRNQEKRLKTLQKTFHKNGNLKTASIPHGQLTETETMRLAELLTHHYAQIIIIPVKSGRTFISFCASDVCGRYAFPHRHSVCFAHTQKRNVIFCCVCVFLGQWHHVLELACTKNN